MSDDHRTPDDLSRRIADAKGKAGLERKKAPSAESRGYAIGVEFVGAVLVGGLLGWFLDRQFGTAPWLMIILLGLGFAAGVRSALKRSKQFDGTPGD